MAKSGGGGAGGGAGRGGQVETPKGPTVATQAQVATAGNALIARWEQELAQPGIKPARAAALRREIGLQQEAIREAGVREQLALIGQRQEQIRGRLKELAQMRREAGDRLEKAQQLEGRTDNRNRKLAQRAARMAATNLSSINGEIQRLQAQQDDLLQQADRVSGRIRG